MSSPVSSGHEIKIVLCGNCALRFDGDTIRALGQRESAVAIFVGTTTQEYDGASFSFNYVLVLTRYPFSFNASPFFCYCCARERGLARMAAGSWYINEDIVDINIFHKRY